MPATPWRNLHLTRGRAEAIARAALGVVVPGLKVGDDLFERAMAAALAASLSVSYSPQVRGAMGGHAKHGTTSKGATASNKREQRRRLEALRLLDEERRIGSVVIER